MTTPKSGSFRDCVTFGKYSIETLAFILMIAGSMILICQLFTLSKSGFDLTDEGFYMIWMSNPWAYTESVSQFGFLLHPVYQVTGGDISAIRKLNYITTFFLASILSLTILSKFNATFTDVRMLAPSLALGCVALLITAFELPQTPSYNTLLFQAFLIGTCSLSWMNSQLTTARYAAVTLLAVSMLLAFLVKPTAAAVFGLLVIGHIVFNESRKVSTIVATSLIFTILFLLFAYTIDGSLGSYILRLKGGLEGLNLLTEKAPSFKYLGDTLFPLSGVLLNIFLILCGFLTTLFLYIHSGRDCWKLIWIFFSIIPTLISIFICIQYKYSIIPLGRFAGVLFIAVPFSTYIYLVVSGLWRQIPRTQYSLSTLFFLLPFAYAFGTERPLWLNAEGAAFYWVLSAIVLLVSCVRANKRNLIIMLIASIVLLMTTLSVSSSSDNPHRQTEALKSQSFPSVVGDSQILLSHDFATYIASMRKIAINAGFRRGTPVIDLTGSSPGTVFILDGVALQTPWLLGGYSGSERFAKHYIDKMSCNEIGESWLLTAPNGTGKIPESILARYGLDIYKDYRDVGYTLRPLTPFSRYHFHHLLKPLSISKAIIQCENAKKNGKK